jgi:oleandomycin transport system permease protein
VTTATLGVSGPGSTAPARRVGMLSGLRHSFTLTWRSVLKIRTNAEDLLGLSLQPIMFLLLFTYVFGGAIAHGDTRAYLQYVMPGILVQTVLFATLGTGLMLNQDISAGIFDRFRSLPIARWAPLAGAIFGDVTRYVISVVVTLGFGMLLGFRVTTNPLAAVAGCALILAFALAMCWVSAWIGLMVKSPQGVQVFGFTAMFPIIFASGLLVPIATMPGWLQAFAKANPMTLLAAASRGLMVRGSGPVAVPAGEAMLWALGILLVFAPLAVRVYRRKT